MAERRSGTPAHPARWRRRLLLAVLSPLFALGLLEAALWLLAPLPALPASRLHRFLPSWNAIGPAPRQVIVDPGRLHGVTPGTVAIEWNEFGYLFPIDRRRRAAADELRIAVVGGSTVECAMLAPGRRATAVLEQLLRDATGRPVTVLNLGVSAQDTRTHLATMAHVATDLDLDICVFVLGTNDLGIATSGNQPMLDGSAFTPWPRWTRALRQALLSTQIGRHLQRLRERPASLTEPYFAAAARRQAALPVRPTPVLPDPHGLDHFARNVRTLAGICRAHGIRPLFATQPSMFPPEPTPEQLAVYWGCDTGAHAISAANFTALLAAVNERLLATCADAGVPCVDLAAAIPKGLECFYDQVHWNEAGARRVAAALLGPLLALRR
jgi:lysophospholipase L1-like esterase